MRKVTKTDINQIHGPFLPFRFSLFTTCISRTKPSISLVHTSYVWSVTKHLQANLCAQENQEVRKWKGEYICAFTSHDSRLHSSLTKKNILNARSNRY